MESLTQILAFLALSGAALVGLGVILKVLRMAFVGTRKFINRMSDAAHVIMYELTPNAGTSMKDAVCRVDKRVEHIDGRVDDLEQWRNSL